MKDFLFLTLGVIGGCCSGRVLIYPPLEITGIVRKAEDFRSACAEGYMRLGKLKINVLKIVFIDEEGKDFGIEWEKGDLGTIRLCLPLDKYHAWLGGKGSIYLKAVYEGKVYEETISFKEFIEKAEKKGLTSIIENIQDSSGVIPVDFWRKVKRTE